MLRDAAPHGAHRRPRRPTPWAVCLGAAAEATAGALDWLAGRCTTVLVVLGAFSVGVLTGPLLQALLR